MRILHNIPPLDSTGDQQYSPYDQKQEQLPSEATNTWDDVATSFSDINLSHMESTVYYGSEDETK